MERPKTTYNHLQPSTTTYNHFKKITTIYNHLKKIHNHSQRIEYYLKQAIIV